MGHVAALGVRNIVWRRHTGAARLDEGAAQTARLLSARGYRFFALDAARDTGAAAPVPIPAGQARARRRLLPSAPLRSHLISTRPVTIRVIVTIREFFTGRRSLPASS